MNLDEMQNDEQLLWQEFVRSPSDRLRNKLIERYSEFARMHAAKLYSDRQIREIEFDEFRQYALVGLIEAVDRYDPERGAQFRTYASHRIRGAILSGIEKYSEKQQQIALRSRLRDERLQVLMSELNSQVDDPFIRLVDLAIGTAIGYMLEDSTMYQRDDDSYQHNIYRSRELSDLVRVIAALVDKLPSQEQTVVRYHYFQQIRFEEIARKMSLTKGRISQIHRKAMERLRENYDELNLFRAEF